MNEEQARRQILDDLKKDTEFQRSLADGIKEATTEAFKRGFKAGTEGGREADAQEERRRCARIASQVGFKAMKTREGLPDRHLPPIAYLPLDGQITAALEIETQIRSAP